MTQSSNSIDAVLVSLGFSQGDNGVLVAPKDSTTRLVPIGRYFEIRIGVDGGNAVAVIVSRVAVKITREGAPSESAVDVDALMNVERKRPW